MVVVILIVVEVEVVMEVVILIVVEVEVVMEVVILIVVEGVVLLLLTMQAAWTASLRLAALGSHQNMWQMKSRGPSAMMKAKEWTSFPTPMKDRKRTRFSDSTSSVWGNRETRGLAALLINTGRFGTPRMKETVHLGVYLTCLVSILRMFTLLNSRASLCLYLYSKSSEDMFYLDSIMTHVRECFYPS